MSGPSGEPTLESQNDVKPLSITQSTTNRESLVTTAVNFLQNRSVVNKTAEEKRTFLMTKGLTENEIKEAFQRLSILFDPSSTNIATSTTVSIQGNGSRLKDWSYFIVVFGGALYGCYKLYKDYLIPFLTNQKTPNEQLVDTLKKTNEALSKLELKLSSIEQSSEKQTTALERLKNHGVSAESHGIKELKDELSSLKRLLLNRHQFPQTPVQKPIIPSWQLEESHKADLSANSNNSDALTAEEGADSTPPDLTATSHPDLQSNTGIHSDGNGQSDIETISHSSGEENSNSQSHCATSPSIGQSQVLNTSELANQPVTGSPLEFLYPHHYSAQSEPSSLTSSPPLSPQHRSLQTNFITPPSHSSLSCSQHHPTSDIVRGFGVQPSLLQSSSSDTLDHSLSYEIKETVEMPGSQESKRKLQAAKKQTYIDYVQSLPINNQEGGEDFGSVGDKSAAVRPQEANVYHDSTLNRSRQHTDVDQQKVPVDTPYWMVHSRYRPTAAREWTASGIPNTLLLQQRLNSTSHCAPTQSSSPVTLGSEHRYDSNNSYTSHDKFTNDHLPDPSFFDPMPTISDNESDHLPVSTTRICQADLTSSEGSAYDLTRNGITRSSEPTQSLIQSHSTGRHRNSLSPENQSQQQKDCSLISPGSSQRSDLGLVSAILDAQLTPELKKFSDYYPDVHQYRCISGTLDKAVGTIKVISGAEVGHIGLINIEQLEQLRKMKQSERQISSVFHSEVFSPLFSCGFYCYPISLRANSNQVLTPGGSMLVITANYSVFAGKPLNKSTTIQTGCTMIKNLSTQTVLQSIDKDTQISGPHHRSDQSQTHCISVKNAATSGRPVVSMVHCGNDAIATLQDHGQTQTKCILSRNARIQVEMDLRPLNGSQCTQTTSFQCSNKTSMTPCVICCDRSTSPEQQATPQMDEAPLFRESQKPDVYLSHHYNPHMMRSDELQSVAGYTSSTEFQDSIDQITLRRLEGTAIIASSTQSFPSLTVCKEVQVQCGTSLYSGETLTTQTRYTMLPTENILLTPFHNTELENHSTQTAETERKSNESPHAHHKVVNPSVLSKETMVYPAAKNNISTNTMQTCYNEASSSTDQIHGQSNMVDASVAASVDVILLSCPARSTMITQTDEPHLNVVNKSTSPVAISSVMNYIKDAFNNVVSPSPKKVSMADDSTMVDKSLIDDDQVLHSKQSVVLSDSECLPIPQTPVCTKIVVTCASDPDVSKVGSQHSNKTFEVKAVQTESIQDTSEAKPLPPSAMDLAMAWDIIETTDDALKLKETRSIIQPPTLEPIAEEIEPDEHAHLGDLEEATVKPEPDRIVFKPSGSKSGRIIKRLDGQIEVVTRSKSEGNLKMIVPGISKEEVKLSRCNPVPSTGSKSQVSDFPTVRSEDFTIRKQEKVEGPIGAELDRNLLAHSNPPSKAKVTLIPDDGDISVNKPGLSNTVSSSGDQALLNYVIGTTDSGSGTLCDGTLSSLSSQFSPSSLTDPDMDTLSLSELLSI